MNTASLQPVDVAGVLERAGGDADAAPGTQGWALAQVHHAFFALIAAVEEEHRTEDARCANWADDAAYLAADEANQGARRRVVEIIAATRCGGLG